jgi:NTE family protein
MQYDMVFEGGGAKGFAFVGALRAFEEAGHTPARLLGTSAGAITATALAAGYTVPEVLDVMQERTPDGKPIFTTFMGDPQPFSDTELDEGSLATLLRQFDAPLIPDALERWTDARLTRWLAGHPTFKHLVALLERGGWFGAGAFVDWMCRVLSRGMDGTRSRAYAGMPLSALHAATGRELTLIAADTTDSRMLILNHRTAPGVPIEWAVRMSMSVPLLWEEVTWRSEWGPYRGRDITGHSVVDGGLLSNFPLALLMSRDERVRAVMGDGGSAKAVGFLIDETLTVPNAPPGRPASETMLFLGGFAPIRRLKGLADAATQAHDRAAIDDYADLVVRLPAKTYETTEFDMTEPRRDALIAAGYAITQLHFGPVGMATPVEPPGETERIDERARAILEE